MVKKFLIYLSIGILIAILGEFVTMVLGWVGLTRYIDTYHPFPIVVLIVCTGFILHKLDKIINKS